MKSGITKVLGLGLVLLLMTLGQTAFAAKTGQISGAVLDASGNPVVGAWVGVIGTNKGAATDSVGEFLITDLVPGEYKLSVSHRQYTGLSGQVSDPVTVRAGETATVAISLSAGRQQAPKVALDSDVTNESEEVRDQNLGKPVPNQQMPLHPRMLEQKRRSSSSGGFSGSGYYGGLHEPQEPQSQLPPFDMYFKDYGTNRYVDTRRDRFSTFGADVDDASYTMAKQYLIDGNIPPRDAIRVEEFINHFDYGYNPPNHEPFRIFTELTDAPARRDITYLKIGIKGREAYEVERKPMNLTFVIDVSGSMGYDNRLELVKRSVDMLLSQLDRRDRIAIVAYGSSAHVVLRPVSANKRGHIMRALRSLRPGGSTYAEAGLREGYQIANAMYAHHAINRIILCSDGVANVGRTSPDAIMREVTRYARKGVTLSTFGFGMGNYNDHLLEQLAKKGNGRYAYINNDNEARQEFVEDFAGNMQVLARDMKIQVEFNPELVAAYRLVGYENRDIADYRFRDDRQDGGEVGVGHEVTALYELKLRRKAHRGSAATVFVRWKDDTGHRVAETSRNVDLRERSSHFASARPELRLAIVAGEFAGLLKGANYAGTNFHDLLARASEIEREMPNEQTRELVDLIRRALELNPYYYSGWDDEGRYNYKDKANWDSNYKRDRR